MRRLLFITALALSLAVPLWAQRGGGGHSGGHAGFGGGHASFSGSHAGGFSSGAHFSSGMRSGFSHGPTRAYNRGFSHGPYLHNGFHNNFHGHFHDHDHFHHRFASNCFGNGCWWFGNPWWGAYYNPWLWDWSNDDARFDADYNNNLAQANEMNEQSLEQQRIMRQEEADGDQDSYARRRPSNDPAPAPVAATPIMSPTVLVFRDHRQQEIQNYAIVGQTLWIFASPHTQKVPLSELDLPATQKANDDRGITFQVPNLNEGQ